MNYHKKTDSSAPPRRESRKRLLNAVTIVLSKNGFRVEVQDPVPEPAASPSVMSRKPKKKEQKESGRQ